MSDTDPADRRTSRDRALAGEAVAAPPPAEGVAPFPLPTRNRPTRHDAHPGDPHADMAVDLRRGRGARGQTTVPSWEQFAALTARVDALEATTPLVRNAGESDDDYIARAVNLGRAPEPGTYNVTKAVVVGD